MENSPLPTSDPFVTINTLRAENCRELLHKPDEYEKGELDSLQRGTPKSSQSSNTMDEMEQHLVKAFTHTANKAIPQMKRPCTHFKDHWHYHDKVKEYNQARKLNRRHNAETTRNLLKAVIRSGREGTKKIKGGKWLEWCGNMDAHTSLSKL